MSFSKMLDLLKEREKGKIVFVKLGAFYIATAEDAVLLHEKLELKCTCFKMNICKVGFPENALEKYIEKLNSTKYAYIIYDYDSKKEELREKLRKIGKQVKTKEKNINCILCKGVNGRYEEDKYLNAYVKMMERNGEVKQNE